MSSSEGARDGAICEFPLNSQIRSPGAKNARAAHFRPANTNPWRLSGAQMSCLGPVLGGPLALLPLVTLAKRALANVFRSRRKRRCETVCLPAIVAAVRSRRRRLRSYLRRGHNSGARELFCNHLIDQEQTAGPLNPRPISIFPLTTGALSRSLRPIHTPALGPRLRLAGRPRRGRGVKWRPRAGVSLPGAGGVVCPSG